MAGTRLYMAPELLGSPIVDGRADLYGVGVVLFELLTGKLPFRASTPLALLQPPPGADEPGASLAGARLKATIPGSELAVVENAGHFPFIEQPDAFLRVLRRFLEARPAS